MSIKTPKIGTLFSVRGNPRNGSVTAHENARLRRALAAATADSTIDKLTGLPNRRGFDMMLEGTINRFLHNPSHEPVIIGFIDIDGLKTANDLHGHAAGDRMIQNFAQKTRTQLRQGDILARPGGDEFLLIAQTKGPSFFKNKMRLFQGLCDTPEERPEQRTKFSIGYAVLDNQFLAEHYPGTARKDLSAHDLAAKLVAIADDAMYQNKKARKAGRDFTEKTATPPAPAQNP